MSEYVYARYFGNYTLVRNSDIKEAKRNWQKALNAKGYYCGKEDGIFGSNTETKTKEFQRNHNLTADGKAGYPTTRGAFLQCPFSTEYFRTPSGTLFICFKVYPVLIVTRLCSVLCYTSANQAYMTSLDYGEV